MRSLSYHEYTPGRSHHNHYHCHHYHDCIPGQSHVAVAAAGGDNPPLCKPPPGMYHADDNDDNDDYDDCDYCDYDYNDYG